MIPIKKFNLFLVAVVLLAVLYSSSAFAGIPPQIQVDGKNVTFTPAPYIHNGSLMLPLNDLSKTLGATLAWDVKKKTVWIHKDMTHIEIPLGKKELYIHRDADFSGIPETVKLNYPIKISQGRTIIPAKVLVDGLGMSATWDKNTKTYAIKQALKAPLTPKPGGKVVWVTMDSKTVVSMELLTLDQQKIRTLNKEELDAVMKSFNEATIDQNPYIMMIAGNTLKVSLADGRIIFFSSYGSKTNVIANFQTGDESHSYHLVAPAIAGLLLQEN